MTYLLDINVVIALIDPLHVHHAAAHRWFRGPAKGSWATCPAVENGTLRVVGNPAYPNSPGSPAAVMPSLKSLLALPGHHFWPDDLSLTQAHWTNPTMLLNAGQLTDIYLLALAARRGGRLASFDARLQTAAVKHGEATLHLIAA